MEKYMKSKFIIPGLFLVLFFYFYSSGGNKYLICETTLDHEHILKTKKIENIVPKEFLLSINPKATTFYSGAYIYPRSVLIKSGKKNRLSTPKGLKDKKYLAHLEHTDDGDQYLLTFTDKSGNRFGMPIWFLDKSALTIRVVDKEKTTGTIMPAVAICRTLDEANGSQRGYFKNKI
jgi:predicted transcriptional regulator